MRSTVRSCIDSFTVLDDEDARALMQSRRDEILQTVKAGARCVVLRLTQESNYNAQRFQLLQNLIDDVLALDPDIEVYVICNSYFRPFLSKAKLSGVKDVLFLDYYLMWVHCAVARGEATLADSWGTHRQRVLFLTGKSGKIHRVRLLHKLLRSELSEHLDWSFRVQDDHEQEICRQFLSDVDDQDFADFMRQQRYYSQQLSPWGMPADFSMFDSARLQIISESQFDCASGHPWITEKTWLAMINQCPFVMAGDLKALDHLERLGFFTFREFLPISNYDDPDQDFFLESRKAELFTPQHRQHWRDFWQVIRDPSWPQDVDLEDIDQLPSHIQQEVSAHYQKPVMCWDELRLQAILDNAAYFYHNMSQFAGVISEQVKHNQRHAQRLGYLNLDLFNHFVQKYQLDLDLSWLLDLHKLTHNKEIA